MNHRERHLHPVSPDPASARIRELTARAARAGYRLVRSPVAPYEWRLVDAADGDGIYSATQLDDIEHWLAT
ncbi:hypothetical protein [Nocardia sp. BMG51109]|uniref:hypothetical protein n=1 Tax=Nocardia sp. BMG51109 TaxID=1056816 RepID=UPI0004673BC9|nr:hypothetical protein [Nocardia sp. BMG51109]